jgi:hypothetical protein
VGSAPDEKIAARLNRPIKSVQMRRQELKRPPFGAKPIRPWTAEEESRLGKLTDKNLARKLNRAVSAVRLRRLALNIRAFDPSRHFWRPEDDKLLGVRPDAQVALLIGATVKSVRHRRAMLGKSPAPQDLANRPQPWTANEDRIVRTQGIDEAVGQLKRTRAAILGRRRLLGIRQITRRNWTPAEDKLFNKLNDKELAEKFGRTISSVENRRTRLRIPVPKPGWRLFTPEEDALLGTAPDVEIAKRLGRHPSSVQTRRLRLGLRKSSPRARRPWTPTEDSLLGTMSDTDLAARLDRHIATVCIRRQKLGVPNFYWVKRSGRSRRFSNRSIH